MEVKISSPIEEITIIGWKANTPLINLHDCELERDFSGLVSYNFIKSRKLSHTIIITVSLYHYDIIILLLVIKKQNRGTRLLGKTYLLVLGR